MLHRNFSNGKERPPGASLFFILSQSASIEEVVEELAKIAAEKGIHVYRFRIKRGSREDFK